LLWTLLRKASGILLLVAALGMAYVLMELTIVKILQHNEKIRAKVLKRCNVVVAPVAGRRFSPYALLRHVGRHSGRTYVTPLGAYPFGDGFVMALAFGPDVDWCRNVLASGHACLTWQGREYALDRPELIPMKTALRAFPLPARLAATGESMPCLWLHHAQPKVDGP